MKKNIQKITFLIFALSAPLLAYAGSISLWSIEKEEGKAWILGSIHVLKEDMLPLPDKISEVLLQADSLVVEIDMLSLDPAEVETTVRHFAIYPSPESQNLLTDLTPGTLKLLEAYLQSNATNIDAMRQMRPWFVSINIGMLELTKRGFKPELGVDLQLMKTARSAGKNIVQLETFAEQIRLLAEDDPDIQDLALRVMLEDMSLMDTYLDQLITAWEQGDAQAMYEASVQGNDRYPQLDAQFKRLIDDRNLRMAKKIEGLLAAPGNILIVVGALHLGGKQGLLHLLSRKHDINQMSDQEN